MALERCTALGADEFRTLVFGRKHLHTTTGLPRDFGDLFSADTLESLLSGGLRTSSVRLVKDGKEQPVTRGCVPERGDAPGSAPFPSTDTIRAGLTAGQTLIVRSLHRFHPPLRRFAHELSAELGHPVKVNAFITPPGSQGVDLHYDLQDVFVLQVAGAKHWTLRRQPLTDPVEGQAWFDVPERRREELRAASESLDDLVLREGESLYFPRGTMHSPYTEDELSIHLTVAVFKTTRHDLLAELVRRSVDDPWLRSSYDPARLEQDPEGARQVLLEAAQRLADVAKSADPADVLWAVRKAAFREFPPEPVPVLPRASAGSAALRVREGTQFRTAEVDGVCRVWVGSRSMSLPAPARELIEALRHTAEFDRAALVARLGAETATTVTESLYDIGLLTAGTGIGRAPGTDDLP